MGPQTQHTLQHIHWSLVYLCLNDRTCSTRTDSEGLMLPYVGAHTVANAVGELLLIGIIRQFALVKIHATTLT